MQEQVSAEMVASVYSVETELGVHVEPATTLLVLESMKMEIPVLSESAGTVTGIRVSAGDVVQEGDVLVVLDLD